MFVKENVIQLRFLQQASQNGQLRQQSKPLPIKGHVSREGFRLIWDYWKYLRRHSYAKCRYKFRF